MQRGLTGHYIPSIADGINCQAFVPLPLPPQPPLALDGKVLDELEHKLDIVRQFTGQQRNCVYAYSAYIELLNRD